MHLHCHNCGWSQDDFWSQDYNPIRGLNCYENILLDPSRLDEVVPVSKITRRQLVLRALRLALERVEDMKYLTKPGRGETCLCPKCQNPLVLNRHREDELPPL